MASRIKSFGRLAAVAAVGSTLVLGMAPAASALEPVDRDRGNNYDLDAEVKFVQDVKDDDSPKVEYEINPSRYVDNDEFKLKGDDKEELEVREGKWLKVSVDFNRKDDCEITKVRGNDNVDVDFDEGDDEFKFRVDDEDDKSRVKVVIECDDDEDEDYDHDGDHDDDDKDDYDKSRAALAS